MGLTQTGTDGIKDDAITLAKQAAGTDGQVITYDASGNPVAVGPGTDGQVLTSTGAGSPPAFEDVPAGGATINNATENEIVTVASNTSQLDAEANLTFDGEQLNVTHAGTTDPENQIVLQTSAIDTGGGSGIFFKSSSSTNANRYGSRIHTTRESGGASNLIFSTEITGGSTGLQEALKISPNKNVTVSDGDLVIGTAGHGIDFSVNSHESGMSSELLDSYEEGTWTTIARNGIASPAYKVQQGYYIKVGHMVMANFIIKWGDCDTNGGHIMLGNVPYTPASSPHDDLGHGLIIYQTMENTGYGKSIQLSGARMDLYSGYNNGWNISNGTNIEDMWIKGGVTYRAA